MMSMWMAFVLLLTVMLEVDLDMNRKYCLDPVGPQEHGEA